MSRRRLLVALPVAVALASVGLAVPASAAPARHLQPAHFGASAAGATPAATSPATGSTHALVGPQAAVPAAASPLVGPAVVYGDLSPTLGRAILMRDLADQSITQVTPWTATDCPDQPKVSADRTKVVYLNAANDPTCSGTVASSIVVRDVASDTSTVIYTPASNFYVELPNWDPDGSRILFTLVQVDAMGNFVDSNLFTVPSGGGTATAIGLNGQHAYDGVFSPNGNKIAYSDFTDPANNFLSIMNADGTNEVQLPASGITTYSSDLPAWSPDGTKLSFQFPKAPFGNAHTYSLGTINVDGTGVRTFASNNQAGWTSYFTTWTPDSTGLLFDQRLVDKTTGFATTNTQIMWTTPGGFRTAVVAASGTDVYYAPDFVEPQPALPAASTFTPVDPIRVHSLTNLGPNGTIDVQVTGVGGVPAGASAVVLNLTGVRGTASTYLQAYPAPASGSAFPKVSNLNLTPGETSAVAVQVSLPPSGKVRIRNAAGTVGVIVDVAGYFATGTGDAGYTPLGVPTRVLDKTLGPNWQWTVNLNALTPVPANTVAVVLNLTAASPTKLTYLSTFPTPASPSPAPVVSNLNVAAGATRANLVTVKVSAGNKINVYNNQGSVRTIVDVEGFYVTTGTRLSYFPLDPTRILDTRYGTNTLNGAPTPIAQNGVLDLPMTGTIITDGGIVRVPATAQVGVFNLAAIPTASTYLTVYPSTAGKPLASNLNPVRGRVTPNLVVTKLGTGGVARIYNALGATHVIGDLAGYYG
jgi:hypothetical protein